MIKIETGSEAADIFIKKIEAETRKDRVKLVLSFGNLDISSNSVDGFFCEDTKRICVNVAKPVENWIDVLAHEYNHYKQWKEPGSIWTIGEYKKANCFASLWDWIDGDLGLNEDIHEIVNRVISIEHDCEKRTIQTLIDNELPVNVAEYTKTANSYLIFLNCVRLTRSWSKADLIGDEKILQKIPDKLMEPKDITREMIKWFD
jgi:hypothetical protein